MNPKKRVLTAITRRAPDRVPMDFSATPEVLRRLHSALNTSTHRQLVERLHVDIVDIRGMVGPVYCSPIPKERTVVDGVRENFWGMRMHTVQTDVGPEEDYRDFVLAAADTVEDLAALRIAHLPARLD
jgi:hypothetical protein